MTPREKAKQADEMAATISPSVLALTVIDQAGRIESMREMLEELRADYSCDCIYTSCRICKTRKEIEDAL